MDAFHIGQHGDRKIFLLITLSLSQASHKLMLIYEQGRLTHPSLTSPQKALSNLSTSCLGR